MALNAVLLLAALVPAFGGAGGAGGARGAGPADQRNTAAIYDTGDVELVETAFLADDGLWVRVVPASREMSVDGPLKRRKDGSLGTSMKGSSNSLSGPGTGPPCPPHTLEFLRDHFDTENGTVITAQANSRATLPCRLKKQNLGVVTWTRKFDYHLLTVGVNTYTVDTRFFVEHIRHLQAWNLQIRNVAHSDAGHYECQISAHPPISLSLFLKVIDAKAEVVGAPDLHIKAGSKLRLVCLLRDSTEAPEFLFWYRGNHMVNYDSHAGVSVATGEDAVRAAGAGPNAYSVLNVQRATPRDTGNYTCVPSNARPASIQVHVLNDESPAAMQHGVHSASGNRSMNNLVFFALLCISMVQSQLR